MVIETLKLENFRNYEALDLSLDAGTNIFFGDNAQGKTNILESVYLCGTTKSHKGARDRDMIRFDREEAHICMELRKHAGLYKIDMHLRKSKGHRHKRRADPQGGRAPWHWQFCIFFPGGLGDH